MKLIAGVLFVATLAARTHLWLTLPILDVFTGRNGA